MSELVDQGRLVFIIFCFTLPAVVSSVATYWRTKRAGLSVFVGGFTNLIVSALAFYIIIEYQLLGIGGGIGLILMLVMSLSIPWAFVSAICAVFVFKRFSGKLD